MIEENIFSYLSIIVIKKLILSMRVLRAVYHFSIKYYQNKNCEVIIPRINPVNLLKEETAHRKEIPSKKLYRCG